MTPSLPLLAVAALATGLVAPSAPAQADPVVDIVEHVVAPALGGYWTPERMARAVPIDPLSTIGKVGKSGERNGGKKGVIGGPERVLGPTRVLPAPSRLLPDPGDLPPAARRALPGHGRLLPSRTLVPLHGREGLLSRLLGPGSGLPTTTALPNTTGLPRTTGGLVGRATAGHGVARQAVGDLTRLRQTASVRQAAPERQAARVPVSTTSGSQWDAGGSVTRTTGRVFLTMKGVDFVCSASAVRSANRDVVVTAGHCVKDGSGPWAENWTFVPGYREGQQPYGSFSARRMFVAGPWSRGGDDNFDVGMVAVTGQGGRHLTDLVGGQQIGFYPKRGLRTYGFGFPADPPYDGEDLLYCAGAVHGDPQGQTRDQGLRCDLTAGASGGPWLTDFDPATGRGMLTSVSSFKYSNDQGTMYGPYFSDAAKDLFRLAEQA
jgi:V8-like Glu-specific endopeptidase